MNLIEIYQFECSGDPQEAAEQLCQEQSTAQWKRLGVDEDFRPKHGAKIIDLVVTPANAGVQSYIVKIAHPIINFGAKIPNLLTAVAGEGAFFSPNIKTIKLIDLEFPEEYLAQFQGPQFGIAGIRDLLNIHDRPIFLGVVKPNIGLSPADFAELAYQSWLGGLDAPKDDEMLADVEYSPFSERMEILGKLRKKAEAETGEKKMFIANITDEVDCLQELHDVAVKNGINAVMLNAWCVGLSAARCLRKKSRVPLVSHFDFVAAFSRVPNFGVSQLVAIKLQRLAGFDVMILPGMGVRMQTTEEELRANIQACVGPMGNIKPALPVPGGSDWAGTVPVLYKKMQGYSPSPLVGEGLRPLAEGGGEGRSPQGCSPQGWRAIDFGMVPGRGVFNHPSGPKAGAKSFRQAWEAIAQKIPIEEQKRKCPELAAAYQKFQV